MLGSFLFRSMFSYCFWGCSLQDNDREKSRVSSRSKQASNLDTHDWRVQAIIEDNQHYLTKDSVVVRQKFKKMASSEYNFMRGTLALYLQHLERNIELKTSFVQSEYARQIPIFGDAHPENIAIYLDPKHVGDDRRVSIEFSDLDSAGYGPWIIDLRRAAMSFRLFYASIVGCGCDENRQTKCDQALEVFWMGYQDGLRNDDSTGLFWERSKVVLKRVLRARDVQKNKKKFKKRVSAERVIVRNETIYDVLVSRREQARGLAQQALTKDQLFLDIAQRYGKGVSSLPATRYVLLWEEKSSGQLELGELRAVFPPPQYPWSVEESEDEKYSIRRMETLRESLWSKLDSDPNYRLLTDGSGETAKIFKLQSQSPYIKDIDLDTLQEWFEDEEINPDDLAQLGYVVGNVLGRAHRRGTPRTTADRTAGDIILADINANGGFSAVWDEIEQTSCLELAIVSEDYRWFSRHWPQILEIAEEK